MTSALSHAIPRTGSRDVARQGVASLCYAPFTNLYFDARGNVRACCWNTKFLVGNVLTHGMDEIWRGPAMTKLRQALRRFEFPRGCEFCEHQVATGVERANLTKFDRLPVRDPATDLPKQMEFSISNACNLECVMCDGDRSSAIRSHREHREPMPRVYSRSVLEGLRPYFGDLRQAKFLGGEPFLVREHYWIWDMMIDDGLDTRCHVTTNATQYNARIERYLDRLPFGFSISLDAFNEETYEAIRVNARFGDVMRNARRFRDYARAKNTSFSFTFCLMRQNWRELGKFCQMADEWDAGVVINTVLWPADMALYTMPAADLRKVVEGLDLEAPELDSTLGRNKNVWFDELKRLRSHLEHLDGLGRPCALSRGRRR